MNWHKLADPAAMQMAWQIETGALGWLLRRGKPDVVLHFLGGLGDEFLLTCVAHEMKRRNPNVRIWQISAVSDALLHNPNYQLVLGKEHWHLRHSNLLDRWRVRPSYSVRVSDSYAVPPRMHLIESMCRTSGLTGEVQLRPWFFFAKKEAEQATPAEMQFCIQSVGIKTRETWATNKLWLHVRFEEVVSWIRHRWPMAKIIQVGIASDLPLCGTEDQRGKRTIRETALLLRQSVCFIGTEGFLVHLTRAVERRSVILYGGRTHAWQTGYPCNENLETRLECAPCWLDQNCDHDRICMKVITVPDVENAVLRVVEKLHQPLETTIANLDVPPAEPLSYPTKPGWSGIANLPPFERQVSHE